MAMTKVIPLIAVALLFQLYVKGEHMTCPANECSYTTIECYSSPCSITCNGYDACKELTVMANYTNTVNVTCRYDNACDDMVIFAQHSTTLTFNSNGYESNGVTIHANNTQWIYVKCRGVYACKYITIMASDAKNSVHVSINAAYNHAFDYGTLYASQASSVSIACSSQEFDYACYYGTWYLPNYGENTRISCYGEGCKYFGDVYVDNSVSSLLIWMNGCNRECMSISDCILLWTFHCRNTYFSDSYPDTDIFYGDSCSSYTSNDCDCVELTRGNTQWDDYKADECVSDMDTDINTDINPISSGSNVAIMSFVGAGIGILVLFCCMLMVGVIICNKNASRRGRANYVAPAPGIEAAVPVQPVQVQQQPRVVYVQAMPQQQQAQMQPRIVYVQPQVQPQAQPQQVQMQMHQSAPGASAPSAPSAPSVYDAPPSYDAVAPSAPNNEGGAVTNY